MIDVISALVVGVAIGFVIRPYVKVPGKDTWNEPEFVEQTQDMDIIDEVPYFLKGDKEWREGLESKRRHHVD